MTSVKKLQGKQGYHVEMNLGLVNIVMKLKDTDGRNVESIEIQPDEGVVVDTGSPARETNYLRVRLVQKPLEEGRFTVDTKSGDAVYLRDNKGEITSWVQDEWKQDPTVVLSIVNAIVIGFTKGPAELRQMIKID